jgi:hypothetical protein
MSTNTAPVKWAQRPDSLFITINLPDVTDEKVELKEKQLTFRYRSLGVVCACVCADSRHLQRH